MAANPAFFELMAQVLPVIALAGAFAADPRRGPNVSALHVLVLFVVVAAEVVALGVVGGGFPNNTITLQIVAVGGIWGGIGFLFWTVRSQQYVLSEQGRPMGRRQVRDSLLALGLLVSVALLLAAVQVARGA